MGTCFAFFGLQDAEKWRSEKRFEKEVEKYPQKVTRSDSRAPEK